MLCDKIYLVSYLFAMYSVLVDCQSEAFVSEMCLEKALTVHIFLTQRRCPYKDLETDAGLNDCSVLCKGIYTTKSTQPLEDPSYNCVWFNISFKLNETLTSKFADFRCGMQDCILDVIEFECTFNRNYTGNPLNKTTSNEKNQINQPVTNDRNGSLNMNDNQNQETYEGNGSCIGPGTSAVIIISCLVGGGLIGVGVFVLVKRFRTHKRILQPPAVFYQPNYGDGGDLPGERTVTIGSPQETEYADIEDTIRMVAKAIQVPSYKEDSSSETRSRENIYHHLSLLEDSSKKESSVVVSNESIRDIFADDVILSNKGSPSFKSVVICTDSSSSKSNGNSKVSPTGSAGSDKYYALEKEYLIFNCSDGNT